MDFRKIVWIVVSTIALSTLSLQQCVQQSYDYNRGIYPLVCKNVSLDSLISSSYTSYGLLNVSESNIPEITSKMFTYLYNLQEFNIYDSNVMEIHPGAFRSVDPKLQIFRAYGNKISSLTKGVFNSLIKLTELDLSKNSIRDIEKNTFLGLESLKYLYLNNNKIEDPNDVLSVRDKLEVLDLSYNRISTTKSFRNFTSLKILKLNNNEISKLSSEQFAVSSITNLDLSSNYIENIDVDVFKRTTNLIELNLASCGKIKSGKLPVGLFQSNIKLQYLNISQTGLKRIIVGTFTGLELLQSLDLSHNHLIYLPRGLFHSLDKLTSLYLNDNLFRHFEYDGFGHLSAVDLNNNPWNCDVLSKIILKLNTTKILEGSTFNSANIYGIGCIEGAKGNGFESGSVANEEPVYNIIERIETNDHNQAGLINLNNTIEEYRTFLETVRGDIRGFYREFSEKLLNIFKNVAVDDITNSSPVKLVEHYFNGSQEYETVPNELYLGDGTVSEQMKKIKLIKIEIQGE